MARPAVLFGGPSPEHDISVLTGLQAARALADAGQEPLGIYWSKNGEFFQVSATLEAKDYVTGVPPKAQPLELVARPGGGFVAAGSGLFKKAQPLDVAAVVNCCHGGPGEDGTLQAALDLAGLAYTGPSMAGAQLGMDKLAFGGVVAAMGLPTLPRHGFTAAGPPPFPGPYILKPRFGGSSIGIEISDDVDALRALVQASPHYRDGAVVEPYRPDLVDLNVSVRVHPTVQVSAVERPLKPAEGGRIYTYAEKYLQGGEGLSSAPRELPAKVPDDVSARIRALAEALVGPLRVRGVPRIDFLWGGDELYVNEINTIPGALAWYFWRHEGVPFPTLLQDMVAEARRGPTRRFVTEGADGTALRAAGTIAGKLA